MPTLQSVRIYPSIGITRLGNSPEWYIGPEHPFPAPPPKPADGKYKDTQCRIRRQAQRFHLFGTYSDGSVRELTIADADSDRTSGAKLLSWTVHVVNAKPSLPQGPGQQAIDPGARTLNGADDVATFANGTTLGVEVPLGQAHTDDAGRLIVVGGFGNSGTTGNVNSLGMGAAFGWYDDVSDGPINARITVGGIAFQTDDPAHNGGVSGGAWVVCLPPRFAPTTYSITTLYDFFVQSWADQKRLPDPAPPALFVRDVYPLLQRALDMRYVTAFAFAAGGHESLPPLIPTGPGQLTGNGALANLAPRATVVGHLTTVAPIMPLLFGAPLKAAQLARMKQWSLGQLTDDWPAVWPPPPPPPNQFDPDGLNRAALETGVGASFQPGFELGTPDFLGLPCIEPLRLDPTALRPGDLTKNVALPWQYEFVACRGPTDAMHAGDNSWWPSARPVAVYTEADPNGLPQLWDRGFFGDPESILTDWKRLGFIVDTGAGKPVETERTAVCKSCFIITDHSEISKGEADALVVSGQQITNAFYLVVEGFSPNDLQGMMPAISLAPMPTGISTPRRPPLFENPGSPAAVQRITFGFDIGFTSTDAADFTAGGSPVAITLSIATVSAVAFIRLTTNPHPYLVDGPTWWLSKDTRVFQFQPGQAPPYPGAPPWRGDPHEFVAAVLGQLRTWAGDANQATRDRAFQSFEGLPPDASLEWLPTGSTGSRVFNFALCRVRWRATNLPANNVRVFFRLFQTAATGTDFDPQRTYKSGGSGPTVIPLLGVQGGELVTIPFFADPRVPNGTSMNDQTDATNVASIPPDPMGGEMYGYFGCWLDFNTMEPRFPLMPGLNVTGPWDPSQFSLQPISTLIRGTHQCLVAEINIDQEAIPPGVSTADSDRLAQRNLVIDDSDNPGGPDAHRVQHTFAVHPSAAKAPARQPPDELMIVWGAVPPGTTATLYLPGVAASAVLDLAARWFNFASLTPVDDHTLQCKTGGVTYVPLPSGGPVDLAGLITLQLPPGVRRGQSFPIVVRQVRALPAAGGGADRREPARQNSRRVLGSFQFTVLVRTEEEMRPIDQGTLEWLWRMVAAVPPANRWYPVIERYIAQLGLRLHALGGGPGTGPGGKGHPGEHGTGWEGKIAGLVFDRFGDFEGFWLDTNEGRRRFRSRERPVERLAREAWLHRIAVLVTTKHAHPEDPVSIVLLGPPRGDP